MKFLKSEIIRWEFVARKLYLKCSEEMNRNPTLTESCMQLNERLSVALAKQRTCTCSLEQHGMALNICKHAILLLMPRHKTTVCQ